MEDGNGECRPCAASILYPPSSILVFPPPRGRVSRWATRITAPVAARAIAAKIANESDRYLIVAETMARGALRERERRRG